MKSKTLTIDREDEFYNIGICIRRVFYILNCTDKYNIDKF